MVERLSLGGLLRVLRAMAEEETQLLEDVLPKKQVLQMLGNKEEDNQDEDIKEEDNESEKRVDHILSLFDLRSISDLVDLEESGGGFVVRVCKHNGVSFDVPVAPQTTVSTLQRKVGRVMIEKDLAPPNTNWFDRTSFLLSL